MFDQHFADVLNFHALLLAFLELGLTIGSNTPFTILLRCRSIFVGKSALDTLTLYDGALHERDQSDVVVWNSKVEGPKARISSLIRGRLNNTMNGGFVKASRQEFQGVARVDDLRYNVI